MLFDSNGYLKMNVSGASMQPLINEGDKIKVRKTTSKEIRKGDIILFRINNAFFVHRFISFSAGKDGKIMIVQCGDNSMEFNAVDENSVVGRVTIIRTPEGKLAVNNGVWFFFNRIIGWLEYFTYISTFKRDKTDDKTLKEVYNRIIYKVIRNAVRLFCIGSHFISKKINSGEKV